jgi:hypothetical protein
MLLLVGLATYKSATFLEQFSIHRIKHEQSQALLQGLLEYGIRVVTAHYQKAQGLDNPWVILVELPDYQALIRINKTGHEFLLIATLIRPNTSSAGLSCTINKEADEKIHIRGFQKT